MDRKNTNYFMVTSHGWSASNWVAHALNLHPEIICTHSARNVLADNKELQSNHNLKRHLRQLHKGYVNRQSRSIIQTYDEIETLGAARYYGSVHVYRVRDLPVINRQFASGKRRIRMVNLVRHPVSLVWSGYGQFRDLFRYDLNELHWTVGKLLRDSREFIYDISNQYELMVGDYEVLAFLGASRVLESLRLDLDALEDLAAIPFLDFRGIQKMEEVTSNPDQFRKMVVELTDDDFNPTKEYLELVFKTGNINRHKKDRRQLTPSERYSIFSPWQKEVFRHFLQKYSIKDAYESYGYDFTFLNTQSYQEPMVQTG